MESEKKDKHTADDAVLRRVLAIAYAAKPISGGSLVVSALGFGLISSGTAALAEVVQNYKKNLSSTDKLAKALAGSLAAGAMAAAFFYLGGKAWGLTGMKTVEESLLSAFLWSKSTIVREATPCGFKTRILPSALQWLGDGAALMPTGEVYTLTAKGFTVWLTKSSGQFLEKTFHCERRDQNFRMVLNFLLTFVPIFLTFLGSRIQNVNKAYGVMRDIIYKVLTSTKDTQLAPVVLPGVTVRFRKLDTKAKLDAIRRGEIQRFKNCHADCTARDLCGKAAKAKTMEEKKKLGRVCGACITDCAGMRKHRRRTDASAADARQRRWLAHRHKGGRSLA